MPEPQATAAPHCPHPSHVCTLLPEHCVAPGVHAGAVGHEHVPQPQLAEQSSVPYVLQGPVALGVHAPCPEHVPLLCQVPWALQIWSSVPQLPQVTGWVCPGAHCPAQPPETQVWSVHAKALP
jgi:hypothetical protein